MVNSVLLNDIDTVSTVSTAITAGEKITFVCKGNIETITAIDNIPVNHKVAVKDAIKGDTVLKYGENIGFATTDIRVGEHVHTHNLDSKL